MTNVVEAVYALLTAATLTYARLEWQPNPTNECVVLYKVFNVENETNIWLGNVTNLAFTETNDTFRPYYEITNAFRGQQVCIVAESWLGESEPTEPIEIPWSPISVQGQRMILTFTLDITQEPQAASTNSAESAVP